MVDVFKAAGIGGPLLVVLLVVVLGWGAVTAILKAWQALLATMQQLVTGGIDAHVREHHAGDERFRNEVREGFRDVTNDIREVHKRIDEFLAEVAKRRTGSDD